MKRLRVAVATAILLVAGLVMAQLAEPDVLLTADGVEQLVPDGQFMTSCDVTADVDCSVWFQARSGGALVREYGPWILWSGEARNIPLKGVGANAIRVALTGGGQVKATAIR